MRTASNSVLSVSPETLSKSAKASTPSKAEGRLFADDFNKAKEALAPKSLTSSEQSSVSQSTASVKSTPRPIAPEQGLSATDAGNLEKSTSTAISPTVEAIAGNEESLQPREGGKKLQSAGVESPATESIGGQKALIAASLPLEDGLLSVDNQALVSGHTNVPTSLAEPLTDTEVTSLMTGSTPNSNQSMVSNTDLAAAQSKLNVSAALTPVDASKVNENTQSGFMKPVAEDVKPNLSKNMTVKGAESKALAAAVGESPALAVTGGEVELAALPSKTEVAKGVQMAQSLEPANQLAPATSSLLTPPFVDEMPVQGKANGNQDLMPTIVGAGASITAASQAGLDDVNIASTELAPSAVVIAQPDKLIASDIVNAQSRLLNAAQAGQQDSINKLVDTSAEKPLLTTEAGASRLAAEDLAASGVSSATVVPTAALGLAALSSLGGAPKVNNEDPDINQTSPLDASTSVADDAELSWVLSQMQSPIDTKTSSGAVAVATAVASPVIGNSKEQKANLMPASSLSGGLKDPNAGPQIPSLFLGGADAQLGSLDKESKFTDMTGDNGVLLNEPIELRKKEQDAMISRMTAQFDGVGSKGDLDTGGMSSSINTNNANRLALGAGVAALQTTNGQANLAMNLPPNHPGWANEMSQKVAWVAREGGHTAHIRLDPPELGSLTVKVSVDHDSNTQVSFVAATPQARDLLEGQMSRLRDMLAQQGMDLSHVDVDVSQQDASGSLYRESTQDNNAGVGRMGILSQQEEGEDDLPLSNVSYTSATGIDYYA